MSNLSSQNIKYRSDIDGIRAIAVLSVIFFHINANWLPGGFLGVDIFFVLSGYLITLLLIKEVHETQKIDILNFYKRRIKRIIPALIFVLIPSFIIGFLFFSPDDLLKFSESIAWSSFSAANFYFNSSIDTGYFAQSTNTLPLLHLWSLGVEEQFYVIWPFILLLLVRYVSSLRRRIFLGSVLFAISLTWAHLTINTNHSFSYFMLPTRAWELLAGAIVALLVFSGFRAKDFFNEVMAFIGLLAIILSFIFVSETDPVPGLAALPVIVGTALLVLSNHSYKTIPARLLSWRGLVAVGLISYSVYLWHWPILAFLRYALIEIDFIIATLVLIATLVMATVSYFLVETPLRKKDVSNKSVFLLYLIVPTTLIILVSIVTIQGVKNKNDFIFPWDELSQVNTDSVSAYADKYNCHSRNFKTKIYEDPRCIYPDNIESASVFLVGDSNASHYLGMLRMFATQFNFDLRNGTQSACPLVFDGEFDWIKPKISKACSIYRHSVFQEIIKYDTVIIGLAWQSYIDNGKEEFKKGFEETLRQVSSKTKRIILLGKIPIMRSYNKECEVRSIRLGNLNCSTRFNNKQPDVEANSWLRDIASQYPNVEYFDVRKQLCLNDECSPYLDGKPVYYDAGHLSMKGSERIGLKMLELRSPALKVFERIDDQSHPYRTHIVLNGETDKKVEFTIKPKPKDKKIAFYLYSDFERVDTQWYSEDHVYILNKKKHGEGRYRVKFFILNGDAEVSNKSEKRETGYSEWYLVN